MSEREPVVQLQRPTSFKVKLQVEPEPRDEESVRRPYSENSWREQLLRLVREAPQPVPVPCSEPRRFPHFGTLASESSWTSDTTRFTGLTLSRGSSLAAELEDVGDTPFGEEDISTDGISESVSNAKNTDTRTSFSVQTHENGKNEICGNEVDDDQVNNLELSQNEEENSSSSSQPTPSSSSTSKPQEDSEASKKVKINEKVHQLQADGTNRGNIYSLGLLSKDNEYWEKFRFSKDYQSSLMIETICNEVFQLMPSSRYKSLMKLSEKRKVGQSAAKKESSQHQKKGNLQLRSVSLKNDGSGGITRGINAEEVEGPRKTKGVEKCCTVQAESNDDLNQKEDEEDPNPVPPEDTENRKKSNASTVSSVWTATTADEGDDRMRTEKMLTMDGFGQTFHGYLTKREAEGLLRENGQYLIRQLWGEQGFILSFRFDEEVRNYRIFCTVTITENSDSGGNNVLYTYYLENRYKPYKALHELVREGLITLYLDENAGSYIDLLMELARQQRNDNLLQTPPAVTPGSRKNSRSASFLRMMRLNSSASSAGGRGSDCDAKNNTSPPASLSIPSTSTSSAKRESMNIALLIHFFEEETFDGLAKCQVCSHALWGSTNKGLRCRDCSLAVHESCIDKVKSECKPNLTTISPFSTDLTTLVKGSLSRTEGSPLAYGPPYILEKCVNEVETRGGLVTEGIYRISGSAEEVESLKKLFERDRVNTSLSECTDIHSITGLIKFFLRQLPDSLITQEVFEEFIRDETGEITAESVQMLVSCLPPAHRITLKYLLDHLERISQERMVNKMSAFNLSSVLSPSVVLGPATMNFETFEEIAMEQLMAHAMATHNQQQHQFHPGQIDMKPFGHPFGQQTHVVTIPQQALMGNPNMGMNPPHTISLQIPDPNKVVQVKIEQQSFNKMQMQPLPPQQQPPHTQNSPFPSPDCQYPMMSPAPLAQNLSVKKEKNPVSGASSSFDVNRSESWMNSNGNGTTATTTKKKKGKKNKKKNAEPIVANNFQPRKFSNPVPAIPEKEKPFECVTCGRRFTQRIGMLQHQRRHTGERPFGCNFCEKRFTQKSGLVQHERLHTNEKPFGCSYCEKAFTQKSGLVQHERTHTGEKPYVCNVCGKAFTQLSGLKQHKKVHERSSDSSK